MRIGAQHRRESRDVSADMVRLGLKAQRGLEAIGQVLYAASQELVPVDTNTLKLSSRVRTEGVGFAAVVYVGYGIKGEIFVGYSEQERRIVTRVPAEYAFYVHQIPKPHLIGQFNYLEEPRTGRETEMRQAFWLTMSTAEA